MVNNSDKLFFLDCINIYAFFFILRKRLKGKIVLLDKPKSSNKFYPLLLKILGFNFSEAAFFTGDLKTENGEAAYLAASDMARNIAVNAAAEILEKNDNLNEINTLFGRNTLLLHLTKQLVWYIRYWTERIIVAKVLAESNNFKVCIISPDRINNNLISKAFPSTEIYFYAPFWFSPLSSFKKSIDFI